MRLGDLQFDNGTCNVIMGPECEYGAVASEKGTVEYE